jgi:hypothetical protein
LIPRVLIMGRLHKISSEVEKWTLMLEYASCCAIFDA